MSESRDKVEDLYELGANLEYPGNMWLKEPLQDPGRINTVHQI